jgi:hypothetical protein
VGDPGGDGVGWLFFEFHCAVSALAAFAGV